MGQEYPAQQRESWICAGGLVEHLITSIDLLPSRRKYLGWNLHLSPNVLARISMPWVGFVLITCALL